MYKADKQVFIAYFKGYITFQQVEFNLNVVML